MRRFAVVLGLVLAACGGGGEEDAPTVRVSTVDLSSMSGFRAAQGAVVRDDAQWRPLWVQHKSYLRPIPELPALDFTRHEVLAVFVGDRPNGCYAVQITEVRDLPTERLVRYRLDEPRDNQPCTLALTQPSHLVMAPASRLPVRFEVAR